MIERAALEDLLEGWNDKALFFDGLDEAIVGMATQFRNAPLVIYSRSSILFILRVRDGMTYEDAEEYMSFNIEGSWMGPNTPLILVDDLK